MNPEIRGLAFEVGRITIEFKSRMLIGTGSGDELYDTSAVADANGLPTLPGTSLAGVLRHAYSAWKGIRVTGSRHPFGFQRGADAASSGVEISFGHIHDSKDRPVPFRAPDAIDDPLLSAITRGAARDHVRINARGVVDDRGKFDTWAVPAGARFTFEILVHEGSGTTLAELVGLLRMPEVTIGAKTRSGLGHFGVVRAEGRFFDLRKRPDLDAYKELPRAIHHAPTSGLLTPVRYEPPRLPGWWTGTIEIEPEADWIFGGGMPSRPDHSSPDRAQLSDKVNVNERRIVWTPGSGKLSELIDVLPATSLKGALRHRVAFHARRRKGEFIRVEDIGPLGSIEWRDREADRVGAVNALFGEINDTDGGRPGSLSLQDGRASDDMPSYYNHVSLDRFTQGPMDGLLFNEAPRHGGRIAFDFALRMERELHQLDEDERLGLEALSDALDDLCAGDLAFGATGSRGFGIARSGRVVWHNGNPLAEVVQ